MTRQHVQIFERGGAVAHVFTTTGAAPAGPMLVEFDPAGAPVPLTLHERILQPARPLAAAELHGALEISGGAPRIRTSAPPELRGLRLDPKESR